MSPPETTSQPGSGDLDGRPGRWGLFFVAIWTLFLIQPLATAWDQRDQLSGWVGYRRVAGSGRVPGTACVSRCWKVRDSAVRMASDRRERVMASSGRSGRSLTREFGLRSSRGIV